MEQRLDPITVAPQGYQAMRQLQAYVNDSTLPHTLQELVKIRAS